MTVSHLFDVLKAPEEITYDEVSSYWTRIRVRLWCGNYTVYLSPNRELQAWTNDVMQLIAIVWNWFTGQVLGVNKEACMSL